MTNRPRFMELDYVSGELAESLPSRIRRAIDHFVWYGIPTGGFVRAVLTNDLMGAIGRADGDSMAKLQVICQYVYNAVPASIIGSKEKVDRHISRWREKTEAMTPERSYG